MIRSRSFATSLVLGAFVTAPLSSASVDAGDYVYGAVQQIADRCAQLGEGFVDVGNGMCGRTNGHIRVGGTRNAAMGGWPAADGTSNAGMRSTSTTMVPGAGITQRLRVRNNLDSVSPFR